MRAPARRSTIFRRLWLGTSLAGAGLALAAPAAAQPAAAAQTGFELTVPVQQSLVRLQEQWLQWMTAYYRGDSRQAAAAVAELRATSEQLGMTRLPELALGATVRALESARDGDFERARWALGAAEQLDRQRPEAAFAAASVARLAAQYPRAIQEHLRGYLRLVLDPVLGTLWLHQAALWLLALLVVAGALCLALQMAVKGEALIADLLAWLRHRLPRLPRPLAAAAVLALLVWPLLLPSGPLWLALYWSVLVWGYGSRSERALLAAWMLLVGVAPLLVAAEQRRLEVRLSPPARAMDLVARGRLSGTLFADLATLRPLLPESVAVRHLFADLHRLLGQWELARPLYLEVLEAEPQNAPALIGLGAYYFRKGDFGRAAEFFQRGAAADRGSAAAYYDLSLAYSEAYQFGESRRALEQARQLDDLLVGAWIREPTPERVVTLEGGLRRTEAIRRELAAVWSDGEPRTGGNLWAPLAAAGALVAAVALHLARRGRYREPRGAGGGLWRWLAALVPGLEPTANGAGGRAFLTVAVMGGLALLPLAGRALRLAPLGYEPGPLLPLIVAAAGLASWLALRLPRALRRG